MANENPISASGVVDSATKVTLPPGAALPTKTIPTPSKVSVQPGWWKVGGIKGSRAAVAKAVQRMDAIPAHWLAALQAEINSHPSPAVTIHAHFSQENKKIKVNGVPSTTRGKVILHLDISPLDGFEADS